MCVRVFSQSSSKRRFPRSVCVDTGGGACRPMALSLNHQGTLCLSSPMLSILPDTKMAARQGRFDPQNKSGLHDFGK